MKFAFLPVYLVQAASQDSNKILPLAWGPDKCLDPVPAASALGNVAVVVEAKDVPLIQKAHNDGRSGQQAANTPQ
ncbi:hypothetical protein AMAG_19811 [Allomyces macrogynus ATCC 38327]|uniref:Uncharacterized protein n=1 Tax=Allomyces macrogynus (strain ATCC 38327) TaxID=578462 RepID=A0A0L0SZU7_ALLM3|nr:hypothetical protein AMAG_19811 [Allomyces macrogynus ATCC 38327]|eukprot:KNE67935.1 hypothetical protein AMAG_19811 [Allomyces macrogynus ATCC 38327]